MSIFKKSGIVNVKMVITEEKILSNIDKIQKLINPNSKKQIVQLEEDSYFKDLVESVKTYLIDYPKKKNFPLSVYKSAYNLVEYATSEFEENTKRVEALIRQREKNIKLANVLKESTSAVKNKAKNWKEVVKKVEKKYPSEIREALILVGKSKNVKSDEYISALKILEAKIANLESNLHIEIDIERIEDKSKALSFIGIEIADALKTIPTPAGDFIMTEGSTKNERNTSNIENVVIPKNVILKPDSKQPSDKKTNKTPQESYIEETRFEVKPSLWQRIKNSKLVRTISYIMQIRVVLEFPALPEGKEENR